MHRPARPWWLIAAALLLLAAGLQADQQPRRTLARGPVTVTFPADHSETEAAAVLDLAVAAWQAIGEKYPLPTPAHVRIDLAATTYAFCRQTRSPWWLASQYRDGIIHLQPVRVLRERGILTTTLRHEIMHALLDAATAGNCPRWLSEALAVFHSGEIEHLKPGRRAAPVTEFSQFETRLAAAQNQEELAALYFTLYRLARFLEEQYGPAKLNSLLRQFQEGKTWPEACLAAWDLPDAEVERQWRRSIHAE
ncbi:MAG: hypothetical protein ONB48_01655 [candidate division KSB1 bacterium]|nr:hypothetical protein [candidate division KSB1 bacterium]MDZ7272616.1 hypothetical protein [candidate division KSB1 bacterium]MDZ7284361.1 hypothetical protein [candidate division KSB1 bacterium]MDZ7297243.1 hypothetical protein [candidate division KSB1 bacterium]MDZ7308310.1 hypothetical protein [candidate division KSB1 bacterium]